MAIEDNETPEDEQTDIALRELPGLIGHVHSRYETAKDGRLIDEQRWMQAWYNFRGIYNSSTAFKTTERSRVFIKITKAKVIAAYGQVSDILFGGGKLPISVEPTPKPEGIADKAHLPAPGEVPPSDFNPFGSAGDGADPEPGFVEPKPSSTIDAILGGLAEKLRGSTLIAGKAEMGQPEIDPAQIAADNMQKVIDDQLEETSAATVLSYTAFEMVLLGTGIVKGPFNFNQTVHRWRKGEQKDATEGDEDSKIPNRVYDPYEKVVPRIEHVSLWDCYPDAVARNDDDLSYMVHRHRLTMSQVYDLKNRPFFDGKTIDECISNKPTYTEEWWERQLRDSSNQVEIDDRWEVLEYWGTVTKEMAESEGFDVTEMKSHQPIQINTWVCGQFILRAVLNPFTPEKIPYHSVPYEVNPYNYFGIGVPENMEDAQKLMNGHMRMAVDNLALAGNMVFDIDESSLVPGQSMQIYPGKIFKRRSGVKGQAVNGITFPNTAPENIQMYDKARQLADEETGIPSVTHGQTGVSGTGRTAAGLSMLMSSGSVGLKTVVKNLDNYLLKPLGESYYRWNMQFNEIDIDIVGDLQIKAVGTASVLQKEVRSQRLTAFLQVVANPLLAPFVKLHKLLKEIASANELDADDMINNPEEAAVFADILRGLNEQPEDATGNGQQQGVGEIAGTSPNGGGLDESGVGGGNVGTGITRTPGEKGFTG